MPVDTTIERCTLPTEAELQQARSVLADAIDLFSSLAWRTRRVADAEAIDEFGGGDEIPAHRRHPSDEVPTLESIGRLFSYGITFRGEIDELLSYVNDVTRTSALDNLDSVRLGAGDA